MKEKEEMEMEEEKEEKDENKAVDERGMSGAAARRDCVLKHGYRCPRMRLIENLQCQEAFDGCGVII